jgi:ketosteroid isomerase-like protein
VRLPIRVGMSAFSNHLRASRDSIEIQAWRSGKDARVQLYTRCLQPAYYAAIEGLIHMKTAMAILIFCLVSILAGPMISAASEANAEPMRTIQLKFAAFNVHDVAAIKNIYASDATLHSPDYPKLVGNSQIADTYRRLFEAIPDARDNIVSIQSAADTVYAQFVLSGHFNGVASKPVTVRIISVYTVKDHHIVGDSTYYDRKAP